MLAQYFNKHSMAYTIVNVLFKFLVCYFLLMKYDGYSERKIRFVIKHKPLQNFFQNIFNLIPNTFLYIVHSFYIFKH